VLSYSNRTTPAQVWSATAGLLDQTEQDERTMDDTLGGIAWQPLRPHRLVLFDCGEEGAANYKATFFEPEDALLTSYVVAMSDDGQTATTERQ